MTESHIEYIHNHAILLDISLLPALNRDIYCQSPVYLVFHHMKQLPDRSPLLQTSIFSIIPLFYKYAKQQRFLSQNPDLLDEYMKQFYGVLCYLLQEFWILSRKKSLMLQEIPLLHNFF